LGNIIENYFNPMIKGPPGFYWRKMAKILRHSPFITKAGPGLGPWKWRNEHSVSMNSVDSSPDPGISFWT